MEPRGRYRKEIKRGYNKVLYNQPSKDETIVSVIKILFREHNIQIDKNIEENYSLDV